MLFDKVKSLRLRYIFLIGIAIRFVFVPFFAHPFDMFAWYNYIEEIKVNGISISSIGIIPVWHSFLILISYIYEWFSNLFQISAIPVSDLPANFNPSYGITVITDPIFNTLIKTPLIIADTLSAFLIYKISIFYTKDYSISKSSAALYFFSPIVIWISAAWGQYDSLAVLFTILSFYLLLVSKRIVFSSLALYIAFFIKIYPIIFIIPIIISILRFEKDRQWKMMSFIVILIPLSIYLIFFDGIAIYSIAEGLLFPSNFFFTSGFGLTYWSVVLITPIDIFWSTLISKIVMIVLVSLSFYYVIKRAKTQFDVVIFGSLFFTIALFLSLTIVSEQRSLILLALLTLGTIYRPSLRNYIIFLSITAFLYTQKNFPFYLLPLASRFQDSFSFLFAYVAQFVNRSSDFISPTPNSGYILFIIGSSFSILLIMLYWKIIKSNNISTIEKI